MLWIILSIVVFLVMIYIYYGLKSLPVYPIYSKCQNQIKNSDQAKQEYGDKLDLLTRIQDVRCLTKMAELYINGIPDKYDLMGHKIQGIAPSPTKALDALHRSYQMGYFPSVFEIAKIYHYGLHDFEPDLQQALNYYGLIYNYGNHQSKLMAQDKIQDIQQEMYHDHVYAWLNLPKPVAKSTVASKSTVVSKPLLGSATTPATTPPTKTIVNINDVFRTGGPNVGPNGAPNVGQAIKNDMHNVHDHSVMTTLRTSYDKLKNALDAKEGSMIPKHNVCRLMREYIRLHMTNDKKIDAVTALDAIERNVIPHTGMDATESDALTVVWNRMEDKFADDKETKDNIKENLANNMAEMIEHGKICCVSGRFSRILDALNIIDDAVQIKPTFAINQEMMDKAGKIRDDVLKSAPDNVRKDYENGMDNDPVQDLEKRIKATIRQELERDYVETDILTRNGFETEISKWIDSI